MTPADLAHLATTRPPPAWQIARAWQLAKNTARRWPTAMSEGIDGDDLLSEALFAAWKQLLTYDPSRGALLSTWIIAGCRVAILEALRRADPLLRVERDAYRLAWARHEADPERVPEPDLPRILLSLETAVFEDPEGYEPIRAGDWLARLDPELEGVPDRLDRKAIVRVALSVLNARQRVIVGHVMHGRTYKQTGALLNLSETRVYQLWLDALHRMREAFGVGEIDSRSLCLHGHPRTPENRIAGGKCRLCRNAMVRARKRAKQEARL